MKIFWGTHNDDLIKNTKFYELNTFVVYISDLIQKNMTILLLKYQIVKIKLKKLTVKNLDVSTLAAKKRNKF